MKYIKSIIMLLLVLVFIGLDVLILYKIYRPTFGGVDLTPASGITFRDALTGTSKSVSFQNDNPQILAQDYLQGVAEGDVVNHIPFSKFGRVSAVNNTALDVCTISGGVVFPTTTEKLVVTGGAQDTSTGTGIRTVYLEGLNAQYVTTTEIVIMNGATGTTTVNSYYRVNYFMARTAGSTGVASSNITIKGQGNTYDQIDAGLSRSRCLKFTVPYNQTLYIVDVFGGCGLGGASPKAQWNVFTTKATWDSNTNATTTFFLPFSDIGVQNQSIDKPLQIPTKLGPTTDLKVSVQGDTSNAYNCNSAIRGWLE